MLQYEVIIFKLYSVLEQVVIIVVVIVVVVVIVCIRVVNYGELHHQIPMGYGQISTQTTLTKSRGQHQQGMVVGLSLQDT